MGLIRGSVSLSNPTRLDLAPLEVSALADSGAVHLCIPEHLAIQLSLPELERRELVLADGHRRCFTGAMVLGNEVLLGAIPLLHQGKTDEIGRVSQAWGRKKRVGVSPEPG